MSAAPSPVDVARSGAQPLEPAATAGAEADAGAGVTAVHRMHSAPVRVAFKAVSALLVVGAVAPALFVGSRPGQFLHSPWISLPLLVLYVWGLHREANARLELGPDEVTTHRLWGRRSLRLDDVASVDFAPDHVHTKGGRIEGRRLVIRSRTPKTWPIQLFVPDRRPLPPTLVARLLGLAPPAASANAPR